MSTTEHHPHTAIKVTDASPAKDTTTTPSPMTPAPAPRPEKTHSNRGLIIALVVICVILAGVAVAAVGIILTRGGDSSQQDAAQTTVVTQAPTTQAPAVTIATPRAATTTAVATTVAQAQPVETSPPQQQSPGPVTDIEHFPTNVSPAISLRISHSTNAGAVDLDFGCPAIDENASSTPRFVARMSDEEYAQEASEVLTTWQEPLRNLWDAAKPDVVVVSYKVVSFTYYNTADDTDFLTKQAQVIYDALRLHMPCAD